MKRPNPHTEALEKARAFALLAMRRERELAGKGPKCEQEALANVVNEALAELDKVEAAWDAYDLQTLADMWGRK